MLKSVRRLRIIELKIDKIIGVGKNRTSDYDNLAR